MIKVNIGNLRNLKQGEDLTFVETSTPWLTSAWYKRLCCLWTFSFLKVPIFERMELAGWWTDSLKRDFPLVLKYWETIQQRFSTLFQGAFF